VSREPRTENREPFSEELGGKLLEGVSRSFFLTLKALPAGLREPLSLAYLLARAADTMADTVAVPHHLRQDCLRDFDRLVQSPDRDAPGEVAFCATLKTLFVPLQEDKHEAQLLLRLHEAFDAFRASPARQMAAMRGVLSPIVRGQLLDIERFPVDGKVRALQSAGELNEYTWLVAGCVGEFWTQLCGEEVLDVFAPGVAKEQMIEWGVRFGKGLQLVNILRDVGKDLRMGRCYFPATELAAHGVSPADLPGDSSRLMAVMQPWRERCREHLDCGVRYLDALQHKRLLFATALPLLIGIRTLVLIEHASPDDLLQGVKISRAEVGKILFDAGIASLRRGGIRKLAEKLKARK
jgi:farnesyl-diphosphate farnesyltransferase